MVSLDFESSSFQPSLSLSLTLSVFSGNIALTHLLLRFLFPRWILHLIDATTVLPFLRSTGRETGRFAQQNWHSQEILGQEANTKQQLKVQCLSFHDQKNGEREREYMRWT